MANDVQLTRVIAFASEKIVSQVDTSRVVGFVLSNEFDDEVPSTPGPSVSRLSAFALEKIIPESRLSRALIFVLTDATDRLIQEAPGNLLSQSQY